MHLSHVAVRDTGGARDRCEVGLEGLLVAWALLKSLGALETCLFNHIFCDICKDKLFLDSRVAPKWGPNFRVHKTRA